MIRLSRLTYRALLVLYPREHRDGYAADTLSLYDELTREARTGPERFALVLRAHLDLLTSLPSVWRLERRRRRVRLEARRRRAKPVSHLSTLTHDVKLAVRLLLKQRAFTAVAAVTLALGIGANAAIFSVTYGVLLRPLGIEDASSLAVVRLHRHQTPGETTGFFPDHLLELRERTEGQGTVERLTSFLYDSVTLDRGGEVSEIGNTVMVDGSFFEVLGVPALVGRTLDAGDVVPRVRGDVCVLAESLWRREFGADPDVVGRQILLDERAVTVVGVLPSGLPIPDAGTELWIPQGWDVEDRSLRGRIVVLARAADGATLEEAQAELRATADSLAESYPRFEEYTVTLQPFQESVVGSARPALVLATAGVGLILLIACANLANLNLARSVTRRPEMATRRALGAKGSQLASQLLAESTTLAALGGTLGIVLAVAFHRALLAIAPSYLPRLSEVRIDLPVFAFAAVVSLGASVVFGLAPLAYVAGAGRSTSSDPSHLRATPQRGRFVSALVVSQLAVSVMLLVAAILMVRSLAALRTEDLGFEPHGLAAARIYLDSDAYDEDEKEQAYFRDLLERLRAEPGIESAGAGSALPLDPITIDFDLPYTIPGREAPPGELRQSYFRSVAPGFLETLRIPLLSGRGLDSSDRADARTVALVNETFAKIAWPGENPVGQRFQIYDGRRELHVVGVVGDVRFAAPGAPMKPEFFVSNEQMSFGSMTVVARSADPGGAARTIRRTALEIDRRQPVESTMSLTELLAGSVATERFLTFVLLSFAALALAISSAGVYGVLSFWVNRSRRELGVRMAMGASAPSIVSLVLRRGLSLAVPGVLLGVAASFVAARWLNSFLFGVGAHDALALLLAVAVLLGAAVLAAWVPARRASRLDPLTTLRAE